MSDTIKVDLSKPANNPTTNDDVIKVDLSNPKKEEQDAVQEQETNDSNAVVEESGDGESSEAVVEEVQEAEEVTEEKEEEEVVNVIQEVSDEESEQEVKEEVKEEAVAEESNPLPENIQKLVDFMQETGGDIQDYTRLNADYSNVDSETLLKEYYKQTKPHLDSVEVDFLLEENFSYDEEIDEERVIKKKKLAMKEEVAKAQKFLEGLKDKYYSEIKLRPGITQEQKKASDFFNRYNEEQKVAKQQHSEFVDATKKMFTQDFKGFDFKLGEKTFRYGVQNKEKVADRQSNINNLLGKFLNDKGQVVDTKGYHKALYAADNVDTIAKHFYEQGKADAIKDVVAKSKNVSTEARATAPSDVTIGGFKVKAISGVDSSKLKIKRKL